MPPIYDFACTIKKCGHEFTEQFSSYSKYEEEKPKMKCPKCSSKKIEKQISKETSFSLKGSGWAKDRYK